MSLLKQDLVVNGKYRLSSTGEIVYFAGYGVFEYTTTDDGAKLETYITDSRYTRKGNGTATTLGEKEVSEVNEDTVVRVSSKSLQLETKRNTLADLLERMKTAKIVLNTNS